MWRKHEAISFAAWHPIADKDRDIKCFSWGNLATHEPGEQEAEIWGYS